MAPAAKALLPPRSRLGAHSSTATRAPRWRAASAAHRAALPAPTTTTSVSMACIGAPAQAATTAPAAIMSSTAAAAKPCSASTWRVCSP